MSEDTEAPESFADRLMTCVPGFGLYQRSESDSWMRGKIGVWASNITCSPRAAEGDPAHGEWSASDAELHCLVDDQGRGPRSGVESDYTSRRAAVGRHRMLVADDALVGVVEGNTIWGGSGNKKVGQLLVWKWDYADIDRIYVGRLKKFLKVWDGEIIIEGKDAGARLHYSGYGEEAAPFRAMDQPAKAARRDGSVALGFAHTLAGAVAAHRGSQVQHRHEQDGKDFEDTFEFSQGGVG